MNIPEEDAEVWDRIISRASRFVSSDFPDVTFEDLHQEVWLWLLEQGNHHLNPYRGGISKVITRKAKFLAWELRKAHLYQTCQYSYRTSDVREILETVFDYSDWDGGFVPKDAQSVDPMDAVEVRADVKWAMSGLPDNYLSVIIARYQLGIEPPSASAQRRTLNRAIQRLTDLMNTYYRQRPRRRAISNAHAAYIIEEQG